MTPRLPALPNLHDHVFEVLAAWYDKFAAQAQAQDSHRHRRGWLKKLVREGHMSLRRLIELTRDKDIGIDADEALRDMAAEMREPLPEILKSYLICFSKPSRGRGRCGGDNWLLDQVIAVCVSLGLERFSGVLLLTKDEGTNGPSICSIMAEVCKSRGRNIKTANRVKQIYDRYAEFMPRHQSWLSTN